MTGGILSDSAILGAVDSGDIEIDPFDPKQLNPASYDLRLGSEVAVYDRWVHSKNEKENPARGWYLSPTSSPVFPATPEDVHDVRLEPKVTRFEIGDGGWILKPGIGYLLATTESVHTKKYVGCIDGKSSLGRLFITAHCTAGYIDPNFRGNVTLEVTVTHSVRVYAGMRIAQIRFHTLHGDVGKLYDGNYKGETSRGPVASRAWKQFERDGK